MNVPRLMIGAKFKVREFRPTRFSLYAQLKPAMNSHSRTPVQWSLCPSHRWPPECHGAPAQLVDDPSWHDGSSAGFSGIDPFHDLSHLLSGAEAWVALLSVSDAYLEKRQGLASWASLRASMALLPIGLLPPTDYPCSGRVSGCGSHLSRLNAECTIEPSHVWKMCRAAYTTLRRQLTCSEGQGRSSQPAKVSC